MAKASKTDDLITAAVVVFLDIGGTCFDWTPVRDKCPRCRVAAGVPVQEVLADYPGLTMYEKQLRRTADLGQTADRSGSRGRERSCG